MVQSKQEYRKAYAARGGDLAALHDVLLEGNRLRPPKLKGILNREAHAKERYDEAGRRLLGLFD